MKQKHIDCLKRLIEITACQHELVEFMQSEKIITPEELTEFSLEADKPKYLCSLLFQANQKEKIQLLAFDWIMLPDERLRLRIVTDIQTKEFSYHF